MVKIKKKTILIFIIIAILIVIYLCFKTKKNNEIIISSNLLDNTKIEWGIKRANNHEQPELGKDRLDILAQNNGIAIGSKESKKIYITFDEGYEAGYTNKILEILKENDVNATFFITAHYLNTEPELVKQMIDEGHVVGNHTPKCLMSGNNIEVKC